MIAVEEDRELSKFNIISQTFGPAPEEPEPLYNILSLMRADYMALYRQALSELTEKGIMAVEPIVNMGGEDETDETDENKQLPVRIDVVLGTQEDYQLVGIQEDTQPGFEPFSAEVASLNIEVSVAPFLWHRCDVLMQGSCEDWQPLLEWFAKWMDLDNSRRDPSGFAGSIHQMSLPAEHPEGTILTIDMGTAPPEAMLELLVTLDHMGLSSFRLGMYTEEQSA